jgi:6-phosphogluconate dehydrogenase
MILMMVPAGAPVAEQIDALTPLLSEGDILIDGGNSDWTDSATARRALGDRGLVSSGSVSRRGGRRASRPVADGGRHEGAWDAAEPILTSIAARSW